mgnify:CR=1 FL=1
MLARQTTAGKSGNRGNKGMGESGEKGEKGGELMNFDTSFHVSLEKIEQVKLENKNI